MPADYAMERQCTGGSSLTPPRLVLRAACFPSRVSFRAPTKKDRCSSIDLEERERP